MKNTLANLLFDVRDVYVPSSSPSPFPGGGFFASFLIGYFIKKIVKIMMFILGGILVLLAYLQFQEIIYVTIKFDKIQSFAEDVINTTVANAIAIFPNDNNPLIIDNNLGIPVSGSIAAGFLLGIKRGG